jgi:hypothetical protein
MSHRIELFIVTAMRTSYLTVYKLDFHDLL